MELIFATRNAHKAEEVAQILAGSGIQLLTLDAFPDLTEEIPEDAPTFDENALQKARYVYQRTGLPCVADDSGLEVDALRGAPGVHSKRFSPEADAPHNNALLLHLLEGQEERAARFRCAIAVVGPEGERTAEGRCEGQIATAPRGEGGFGYDPIFLPEDYPGRAMAELSMGEKNAISHRGRAFRQLPSLLKRRD
ncbi:MAG: RdgB/HAM1 family non-canonical purine NTP pyrophosphatase [Deltaproteobacteria bacterium]|nr:RdgB/HAM1 family non-canonical purine NTP pyrophosphatase [Deltaproteobacteria bacterium]